MSQNPVTDSRLRVRDIFTLVFFTSILAFLAQCGSEGTQTKTSYLEPAPLPARGY